MAKAKTPHQTLTPRWVLPSVIGALLLFTAFEAHQMASAQTSAFTNPSCDPSTNPNCNPPAPLFLSPSDKNQAQIVESPVQIGKSAGLKDLALYGGLTLQATADSTKKIQTAANYSGQAINVASTGNHAIYGASSGNLMAGVYGIAQSVNSYGVAASTGTYNTFAIFADATTGGNAAKFIGPVLLSNGSENLTLKVNSSSQLLVNDIPAGGSQKIITLTGATGTGATKTTNIFSGADKFPVTSIQVLYRDDAVKDYWKVLAAGSINYKECTGNVFTGSLELTNPVATQDYRITIAYDASATVVCGIPPPTFTASPTSVPIPANSTVSTVNLTSNMNAASTGTWTWKFEHLDASYGLVDVPYTCSGTSFTTACIVDDGYFMAVSGTLGAPTITLQPFLNGSYVRITLTTTNPVGSKVYLLKVYKALRTKVTPRANLLNYSVTYSNLSAPGLLGDLSCSWDFGDGNLFGPYSPCTSQVTANYLSGGTKTVKLRAREGTNAYSEYIGQATFVCTQATRLTDCATGVCDTTGYCGVAVCDPLVGC